jgi:hypothetical protein
MDGRSRIGRSPQTARLMRLCNQFTHAGLDNGAQTFPICFPFSSPLKPFLL